MEKHNDRMNFKMKHNNSSHKYYLNKNAEEIKSLKNELVEANSS